MAAEAALWPADTTEKTGKPPIGSEPPTVKGQRGSQFVGLTRSTTGEPKTEPTSPKPIANGRVQPPRIAHDDVPGRARALLWSPGFRESIAGERGHDAIYHAAAVLVNDFGRAEAEAWPILRDWNAERPPTRE